MNPIFSILLGLLGLGFLAGGAGASGGGTDPGTDPDPGSGGSGTDMPVLPDGAYDIGWGGLSPEEQLMVELVNRARLDPAAEVDRQGVGLAAGVSSEPVQALAVVDSLSDAARAHSADMEARDYFSHTTPEGDGPTARAVDAGWTGGGVGENIGAKFTSASTIPDYPAWIEDHHANLWASPGHQANLMSPGYDVVGMGYAAGDYLDGGTYWPTATFVTEAFASAGSAVYLTGVVIDDTDGDRFYDMGEGQGGVHVTAWNDAGAYATSTWDAGGYSLALASGSYTVRFEGGELSTPYETTVVLGGENVKLDVIEGGTASAGLTLADAAPGDVPPEPVAEGSLVSASGDGAATADDPVATLFAAGEVIAEDAPLRVQHDDEDEEELALL